jgi:hypothetical protein
MPTKSTRSLPQRIVMCLLCSAMLAISGCKQANQEIAGISIPIPEKMTRNADKNFAPLPGFEDGQASYEGKVSPAEIFTFYQEVMAAKGWQPTARFSEHQDRIAYTKDNRIVLIRYEQVRGGTTVLTIMVGTENPPK